MRKIKKDILWTIDFFLVWQGLLISCLGDTAYNIVLGFWVLQVTGSTAIMGTLMAVSTLLGILVLPFAGVWIERLNRKYLLISMDVVRGISLLLITLAAFTNLLTVWMVFVAGIIISISGAVFRPCVNTTVPEIIPVTRLTNANSILLIASTGSNILGNVIGGYFYQLLGAPILFLADGLSYLLSGSSLAFARVPKIKTKRQQNFFGDMKDGFQFMWNQKGLRYLLMLTALVNFFSYVAIVLFLPLFQRTPYLGAGKYGVAMACFMGGSMLGFSLTTVLAIPQKKRLNIFIFSNIFSNVSLIIALNQHTFAFMIPFIFIGGFLNAIYNVIMISTIQATTPSEMRGKVMAFTNMSTQCLTPFAMAFGGFLALYFQVKSIINVSLMIIVIAISLFAFVKPFMEYIGYKENAK
ncbi:MAG: MFS transporter [Ruminiclostridium sp.]